MGLPTIDVIFSQKAVKTVREIQHGIVAIILKDSAEAGAHTLTSETQIPEDLSADNKAYIERAFVGYVNQPSKVLLYVLEAAAEDLSDALDYFATQTFDYLVGPPNLDSTGSKEIVAWLKAQWADDFTPRAVLPNEAADFEGVVNLTTSNIEVAESTLTTAQFCSRIAGLICGTPINISCTSAPLLEVTNVARLSKEEMDTAVDNGEFILWHDGEKVKVGRGVNSFKTTTLDKGNIYKKIKIVDAICTMKRDLKLLIEDEYIGKFPNSYDNKCILLNNVQSYFDSMEQQGALNPGTSVVEIDLDAQKNYLSSTGVDVSEMSDDEIKKADTGSQVFLKATIQLLDAIEDVTLKVTV